MKATLKHYRQSPRKVRLVGDFVRGMSVSEALVALSRLPKRAANQFAKVISSAAANAKDKDGLSPEELVVKEVRVDQGIVFHRFQARARGRATPIRKKTSHITVRLAKKSK